MYICLDMSHKTGKNLVLWSIFLIINLVHGVPVPGPNPQVLPGQIPPHLATHPALSSVTQGKESALMQFAYNIQNRRGPNPSPLVLQNNQERNLQLVNSLSQQRNGQAFIPGQGGGNGGHSHSQGSENPQVRAYDLLQQYKGQGGQQQNSNSYNPAPLTPSNNGHVHGHNNYGNGHSHSHYPQQGGGSSAGPPGDENEGEDIRRLKSILNLAGRQIPGSQNAAYGSGSPSIGVAGERGVLNPSQYGQRHDHHHPTPIPATAQSTHSLGSLQYGQNSRNSLYSGSGGPTSGPSPIHIPYGSTDQHSHHGHDHHHPGQGIYNHYDYNNNHNSYDQYRASRPSEFQQFRPNEFHNFRPGSRDYNQHQSRPDSRDYSRDYRQHQYYPDSRDSLRQHQFRPNDIHHQEHQGRNEFDRYRPSNTRNSYRK